MENFVTIGDFKNNNNGKISKLWIKKQLESGKLEVFEVNQNHDSVYRKINPSSILNMWDGFFLNFKYESDERTLKAHLGTSFYYKFSFSK